MKRFIQGEHRGQGTLLPESLDVFVDELDLVNLDFEGAIPADTCRPAYHPAILPKIYIYGYLTAFSRAGGWNEKLNATSS